MARSIGVVVSENARLGVVDGDHVAGPLVHYPHDIRAMPADELAKVIADEIKALAEGEQVDAVGLALPGIIRNGTIEESPNLQQLKGFPIGSVMSGALADRGIHGRVVVSNDADVVASGIAAAHGQLHRMVRVWTLGDGVGFGRYPVADGVWEGGHIVVTLDPNEKFCGCHGIGHLESIMGHRAMRLRFLDMEPEEVFEAASKPGADAKITDFVALWHRALAAATASSIHMSGPGRFYLTGRNARFINLGLLNRNVQEMVKMSPLQGYVFEVVQKSDELGVIGAVVNARHG